ncbi:Serine--tRNA ligase, partial [Dichanthelium oligosanthes]
MASNRIASPPVDEAVALDKTWRKMQYELEQIRRELNATSKAIGRLKGAGKQDEEAEKLMEATNEIKQRLATKEAEVTGDGDEKYLIATSEQALCAYHLGDRIYNAELPIRYAGYSTCFRKEAAHGRDTAGIFRVHQFEKIEQFCITSPNGNEPWEMFEEMIQNSQDFYKENRRVDKSEGDGPSAFAPHRRRPPSRATMLDINLFRADKGGNPDLIRESQRSRFASVELVDEVIALDKAWRERQFELDKIRQELNATSKKIGKLKASKQEEEAKKLMESTDEIKKRLAAKEAEVQEAKSSLDAKLTTIGNIVHESVPVSDDEANNLIVRTWGEKRVEEKLKNHVDLCIMLDIVALDKATEMKLWDLYPSAYYVLNFEPFEYLTVKEPLLSVGQEDSTSYNLLPIQNFSGADVAGGRGYYLKDEGVLLNLALINFGLAFLRKRGFKPMQTPFFMRKETMGKCAQLAQFDEELYKVRLMKYSLHAYHAFTAQLYAGYSTCFRKEAGSHGRDTAGIFRVHQFEKIEQFCVTSPNGNDSWETHEEMLKNSEDFYQEIGLPYQVVSIVSGALNDAAAKKYDLEAWFPASKTFRELVSCSNCTDFQARRLGIGYGQKKNDEQSKQFVHMLNSTLTATERTLCCILENFQKEDGVEVPKALQPYMGGIEFLPFKQPLDVKQAADSKSNKAKSK